MNLEFRGFVGATGHGSCWFLLRHQKKYPPRVHNPCHRRNVFQSPLAVWTDIHFLFCSCLSQNIVRHLHVNFLRAKHENNVSVSKGKPLSPFHDVKDACYLKRVTFPTDQHVNTKGTNFKTSSSDIETHWGACRENKIKKHWRCSNDTKVGNVWSSRSTWHNGIKTTN